MRRNGAAAPSYMPTERLLAPEASGMMNVSWKTVVPPISAWSAAPEFA